MTPKVLQKIMAKIFYFIYKHIKGWNQQDENGCAILSPLNDRIWSPWVHSWGWSFT
jgi:hypothetical protein